MLRRVTGMEPEFTSTEPEMSPALLGVEAVNVKDPLAPDARCRAEFCCAVENVLYLLPAFGCHSPLTAASSR